MAKTGLKLSECHPILLSGNHTVVKFLITLEHLHLLHTGPTLVADSLSHNYSDFLIIPIALCQEILNTGRKSDLVRISEPPVNLIVLHNHGNDR